MSACDAHVHELDALLHGELPAPRAQELSAHAATCAGCARELSWLRAERAALPARPAAPAAIVPLRAGRGSARFAQVRARAQAMERRSRRTARWSVAFGALGAAAALLIAVQGAASERSGPPPETELSMSEPWCGERPDAVGRIESEYSACLTATPRALPGSPAVCL